MYVQASKLEPDVLLINLEAAAALVSSDTKASAAAWFTKQYVQ